jgi:phage regulator Rha-like protein
MNILPVMKLLTMTSREIAELTGKRHDNVLRDIDELLKDISSELRRSIKLITYQDKQGRSYRQYELDFRATMLVITGYSGELRLRVIDRWQELETQATAQAAKITAASSWDQQRQAGKEVRANFTNTLENHGVSGFGFAQCTNGIYRALFGTTAANLKQQRGLAKTASLRDSMNSKELIASTFAEIVASERMDVNADQGNSPCYKTCKASGEAVSDLLVKKLN